jgi:hypothetical protein
VNPHACSYQRIRSLLTELERPFIEGLLGRYFGGYRKLRLRVATDRSWDVAEVQVDESRVSNFGSVPFAY